MALLDLAPELLDEIIGYCMPEGFESFALSCKGLYTSCTPRIPLHNKLSKRWKHATNKFPRRHDTFRIMFEIAKEPLIARYIQHIDLWDREKLVTPGHDCDEEFRNDKAAMQKIKPLIMDSPVSQYLLLAHVDPEDWWSQLLVPRTWIRGSFQLVPWRSEIEEIRLNEEYAFLALLLLLPNLQSMRPFREWNDDMNLHNPNDHEERYIYPVLDAIVKHSRSPNSVDYPLSKLGTLYPSCFQGSHQRATIHNLQWFLQLPFVSTMYVVSCMTTTYTPSRTFSWRMPSIPSNLTRLELAYSWMFVEHLSVVLSNTPRLQVFKYGEQQKGAGGTLEWSAQRFVETVAKYCGGTIQDLAITMHSRGRIQHGVQDFLGFRVLKKLEIDLQILCGPSEESGRASIWVGVGKPWQVPDGKYKWEGAELPCLASILPESLGRVDINIDDSSGTGPAMMALLTDFAEERTARLPALNKVLFRQLGYGSERDMVELEECEFEVYKLDNDTNPWQESQRTLALWVREFEEKAGVESSYGS